MIKRHKEYIAEIKSLQRQVVVLWQLTKAISGGTTQLGFEILGL